MLIGAAGIGCILALAFYQRGRFGQVMVGKVIDAAQEGYRGSHDLAEEVAAKIRGWF